jgi:hypothetical protein
MTKQMLYNREQRISIRFGNTTHDFVLIALSAKAKEIMIADAQKIHAHSVELLKEAAESMRSIYRLQDMEILIQAMLRAEHELFLAKAALTLAEDEADYREKIAAKAESMVQERRAELIQTDKEQLVNKLISFEIDRQLHNAWACAILDATLVGVLHDENWQRIFYSVDEMKAAMPPEVLEKLYEALVEFLAECANAQVFLKPHTSKN